jgi:hypothetical protein
VVVSERASASSGGEAEAMRPARPGFRRGAAGCGAIEGGGGTKESLRACLRRWLRWGRPGKATLRRWHGWHGGAAGAGLGGARRKGECLYRGRPDHGDDGVMPRP